MIVTLRKLKAGYAGLHPSTRNYVYRVYEYIRPGIIAPTPTATDNAGLGQDSTNSTSDK